MEESRVILCGRPLLDDRFPSEGVDVDVETAADPGSPFPSNTSPPESSSTSEPSTEPTATPSPVTRPRSFVDLSCLARAGTAEEEMVDTGLLLIPAVSRRRG